MTEVPGTTIKVDKEDDLENPIIATMSSGRFMMWLITVLLLLQGNHAFAGQGCCSMHGGVVGCAGTKLQCNDGTLSATCSCRERSNVKSPIPQAQDGLALLEAAPQEAKPYVTPVAEPSPTALIDAVPPAQGNKPYVTLAAQPEIPAQADVLPSQEPPKPYTNNATGNENGDISSPNVREKIQKPI